MPSPSDYPDPDAYLALFARYRDELGGLDFGRAYLSPEDDRYRLLFDQLCRLLTRPSAFNLAMPQEFRRTAHRYLAGDARTQAHMRTPEMRHFMLSDLYDYVHLSSRLGHPV